jgi:hypothetical protein
MDGGLESTRTVMWLVANHELSSPDITPNWEESGQVTPLYVLNHHDNST